MKNYSKVSVPTGEARIELHDRLQLTGAEVSVNTLPAGAGVPFVHSHKKNEEIYAILAGKGKAVIDGSEIELDAGDWIRVAPEGKRQFSAAADSSVTYACIQVKAGSLEGYTADDAVCDK
jgi:mannose-6-phosphate isomerase-like protein (cupin superfamily)